MSSDRPKRFEEHRDFFLAYPSLLCPSWEYAQVQEFYNSNKYQQRSLLHDEDVPVPKTIGIHGEHFDGPYVCRPLRHRGGHHFHVTDEYSLSPEIYISALFPKKHEYRVIYCKGHKVATLYKRVPEGIGVDQPWNHTNGSYFVSVNQEDNDRLRHTNCYEKLSACSYIQHADLVAADILLDRERNYVVCELNFAPAITIPQTLESIRAIVHGE